MKRRRSRVRKKRVSVRHNADGPNGDWKWERHDPNGYEVSSRGDRRFSAFYAKLPDGTTIEKAYQAAKGTGKGKPARDPNFDYWGTYLSLWKTWADASPELLRELSIKAKGKVLTDQFASTENNQARALAHLLNERHPRKNADGYTGPEKVISGGQTGADLAALEAAAELGISTGGWMTKGFRTETGQTWKGLTSGSPAFGRKVAKTFGLQENAVKNYPARNKKNAADSDRAIIYTRDQQSGGTLQTIKFLGGGAGENDRFVYIDPDDAGAVQQTVDFLRAKQPRTLYVAGNREAVRKPMFARVKQILTRAFSELRSPGDKGSARSEKGFWVDKLEPYQIFVFGSNTQGRHGAGAARTAKQKFGAIGGQARGLQGQSYAIITKDLTKTHHPSIPLSQIQRQLEGLAIFANEHPHLEFLLTKIGGDLAGFDFEKEIEPLIEAAQLPRNVIFTWKDPKPIPRSGNGSGGGNGNGEETGPIDSFTGDYEFLSNSFPIPRGIKYNWQAITTTTKRVRTLDDKMVEQRVSKTQSFGGTYKSVEDAYRDRMASPPFIDTKTTKGQKEAQNLLSKLLRLKFTPPAWSPVRIKGQPELIAKLRATYPRKIIAPPSSLDVLGKNVLGRLLEKIRAQFVDVREKKKKPVSVPDSEYYAPKPPESHEYPVVLKGSPFKGGSNNAIVLIHDRSDVNITVDNGLSFPPMVTAFIDSLPSYEDRGVVQAALQQWAEGKSGHINPEFFAGNLAVPVSGGSLAVALYRIPRRGSKGSHPLIMEMEHTEVGGFIGFVYLAGSEGKRVNRALSVIEVPREKSHEGKLATAKALKCALFAGAAAKTKYDVVSPSSVREAGLRVYDDAAAFQKAIYNFYNELSRTPIKQVLAASPSHGNFPPRSLYLFSPDSFIYNVEPGGYPTVVPKVYDKASLYSGLNVSEMRPQIMSLRAEYKDADLFIVQPFPKRIQTGLSPASRPAQAKTLPLSSNSVLMELWRTGLIEDAPSCAKPLATTWDPDARRSGPQVEGYDGLDYVLPDVRLVCVSNPRPMADGDYLLTRLYQPYNSEHYLNMLVPSRVQDAKDIVSGLGSLTAIKKKYHRSRTEAERGDSPFALPTYFLNVIALDDSERYEAQSWNLHQIAKLERDFRRANTTLKNTKSETLLGQFPSLKETYGFGDFDTIAFFDAIRSIAETPRFEGRHKVFVLDFVQMRKFTEQDGYFIDRLEEIVDELNAFLLSENLPGVSFEVFGVPDSPKRRMALEVKAEGRALGEMDPLQMVAKVQQKIQVDQAGRLVPSEGVVSGGKLIGWMGVVEGRVARGKGKDTFLWQGEEAVYPQFRDIAPILLYTGKCGLTGWEETYSEEPEKSEEKKTELRPFLTASTVLLEDPKVGQQFKEAVLEGKKNLGFGYSDGNLQFGETGFFLVNGRQVYARNLGFKLFDEVDVTSILKAMNKPKRSVARALMVKGDSQFWLAHKADWKEDRMWLFAFSPTIEGLPTLEGMEEDSGSKSSEGLKVIHELRIPSCLSPIIASHFGVKVDPAYRLNALRIPMNAPLRLGGGREYFAKWWALSTGKLNKRVSLPFDVNEVPTLGALIPKSLEGMFASEKLSAEEKKKKVEDAQKYKHLRSFTLYAVYDDGLVAKVDTRLPRAMYTKEQQEIIQKYGMRDPDLSKPHTAEYYPVIPYFINPFDHFYEDYIASLGLTDDIVAAQFPDRMNKAKGNSPLNRGEPSANEIAEVEKWQVARYSNPERNHRAVHFMRTNNRPAAKRAMEGTSTPTERAELRAHYKRSMRGYPYGRRDWDTPQRTWRAREVEGAIREELKAQRRKKFNAKGQPLGPLTWFDHNARRWKIAVKEVRGFGPVYWEAFVEWDRPVGPKGLPVGVVSKWMEVDKFSAAIAENAKNLYTGVFDAFWTQHRGSAVDAVLALTPDIDLDLVNRSPEQEGLRVKAMFDRAKNRVEFLYDERYVGEIGLPEYMYRGSKFNRPPERTAEYVFPLIRAELAVFNIEIPPTDSSYYSAATVFSENLKGPPFETIYGDPYINRFEVLERIMGVLAAVDHSKGSEHWKKTLLTGAKGLYQGGRYVKVWSLESVGRLVSEYQKTMPRTQFILNGLISDEIRLSLQSLSLPGQAAQYEREGSIPLYDEKENFIFILLANLFIAANNWIVQPQVKNGKIDLVYNLDFAHMEDSMSAAYRDKNFELLGHQVMLLLSGKTENLGTIFRGGKGEEGLYQDQPWDGATSTFLDEFETLFRGMAEQTGKSGTIYVKDPDNLTTAQKKKQVLGWTVLALEDKPKENPKRRKKRRRRKVR